MAQHFQSLSVTEQPSGNDNGGKLASAKTKTAAKAHPGEPPGHFKLKPCNKCNRSLPLENFANKQSRCRDCDKEERSWQNGCGHAFGKGWLEKQDVKNLKDLRKKWTAARTLAQKETGKIKFNYKEQWHDIYFEKGKEYLEDSKLMWEDEYYEWGTTKVGGSIGPQEMRENWEKWKNDPQSYPQLTNAQGRTQIAIPGFSLMLRNFQRIGERCGTTEKMKLNKNQTAMSRFGGAL